MKRIEAMSLRIIILEQNDLTQLQLLELTISLRFVLVSTYKISLCMI